MSQIIPPHTAATYFQVLEMFLSKTQISKWNRNFIARVCQLRHKEWDIARRSNLSD